MQTQVAVDELTGALRRAAGEARLEQEIRRARRLAGGRLLIAFIDVDGLKAVNDGAGHAAGDRLLQFVVGTLRARLRSYDTIIRWGGDEFVCILPQTGPEAAERIFAGVVDSFSAQTGQRFSVGYGELREGDALPDLVARADQDLYRRKVRPVSQAAPAPPPDRAQRGPVTRRMLEFLRGHPASPGE
jgi:diguanylate cyclase (GGDEF)-like protein